MNQIVEQLSSKPDTQAMITYFLNDLKEYIKKLPLLTQDKTHDRILKFAETTHKYMPDFSCFTNLALKIVSVLKVKVNDKIEDMKAEQLKNQKQNKNVQKTQTSLEDEFGQLDKLQTKLSREKDATTAAALKLNRQVNQQFLRKQLFEVINQIIQQFQEAETNVRNELLRNLQNGSNILFFDSYLRNISIINKISAQKNIKVTSVKISESDPKNNEISLKQVASKIRKYQTVIISGQTILKNGAIVANSGALMIALAAKKYGIPVIVLTRGFCFSQKIMIDQFLLLSQNPMKYFQKSEQNTLKVFIAKKYDLLDSSLISLIIDELGTINPSSIELHFSSYYGYN